MHCTSQGIIRARRQKTAKAKPLEPTEKRQDPKKRKEKIIPADSPIWSILT